MGQALVGGSQGPRDGMSRRGTDGRVIRCSTFGGWGRDHPHQVICITEMVSYKNGGFNYWKVLGTEIIKLTIVFEGLVYTPCYFIPLHVLLYVILITTL